MNHLIVNKTQTQAIKGRHGQYSFIEPRKTPDGNYIIPEKCINDPDLIEVRYILETINDIQDITDIPIVGQECIKDRIYKYYDTLVKCVQTHNRTIFTPEETPALWSFFRENSDTLEWIINEWVEIGWKRIYEGITYEVIQSHQTLLTWNPTLTLGVLWKTVAITSEWTIGVAYKIGDIVTYLGNTYKCLQAHTSISTWYPSIVPSLWQLQ